MCPISLKVCGNAIVAVLLMASIGCSGMQTFTTAARPGETIALAAGWRQHMDRNNLTVTITDSSSPTPQQFIYAPGDPAIRAVINNYPDPISNMRVGYETGQNIVGNETLWGTLIQGNITNWDKDWSQKFIILDLPAGIAAGAATVDISVSLAGGGTEVLLPQNIEILGGVGSSTQNPFINWDGFAVSPGALQAMERANHYTVTFSGATLPQAIQLDLVHDNGVGTAYVANAGGNVKNVHWSDDGQNMRVILLPARDQSITDWNDFKFYVAGEITGLAVIPTSVQAFDINGIPVTGMDTPLVQ